MKALMRRRSTVEPAAPARKVARGRTAVNRSLERQAEEATQLALHGVVDASRVLTPAPAAAFRTPESRGEPLPASVRREAEVAFGADLQAVRIHRDAPAWTAARELGAAAFTAGTHIYFDERRWDPSSETGKRLLYHEIAHVLQQTGRREAATRIRARERTDSGDVQAVPERRTR